MLSVFAEEKVTLLKKPPVFMASQQGDNNVSMTMLQITSSWSH